MCLAMFFKWLAPVGPSHGSGYRSPSIAGLNPPLNQTMERK
ncbi:hypothetical protein BN1708_006371 [Verticillium longisporum]|uniref:Uncharacterized protein n=1 Tax=Verticillium longisporum TaxID=100787 RepID=A0A0G4MJQ3_VERLO|nr:hypothetical protein BN1708_006371 [Verticillium longisporum]